MELHGKRRRGRIFADVIKEDMVIKEKNDDKQLKLHICLCQCQKLFESCVHFCTMKKVQML